MRIVSGAWRQTRLERNAFKAQLKEVSEEVAEAKKSHATEVAQLNHAHAETVTRLQESLTRAHAEVRCITHYSPRSYVLDRLHYTPRSHVYNSRVHMSIIAEFTCL